MKRRDFLKAGAILGAGAVAAAASYATLGPTGTVRTSSRSVNSNGSSVASTATTATTAASTSSSTATDIALQSRLNDPNVPSEYKEFLRWLQSVSGDYRGTKIAINLQDEPDYRALQNLDIDFYSASGINSQYDLEPYVINLEKTTLAVKTGSSSIDVIDFDALDIPTFEQYLLSPQVLAETYPDLTYPGLDLDDFMSTPMNLIATYPPVLPGASTPSGELFCLPFNAPVMIRYYRTDVYDTMSIDPPASWDDYFSDMQTIGTRSIVYGCVSQAATTTPIFHEFTNHLYSFGGELWDVNGDSITPTVNTSQNVQALENFARFYPYTLPSSISFTWDDCVQSMAQGQAANAITFEDDSGLIFDPLRSIEQSNMAFSANPAGPSGAYSTYIGDGLGISMFCKNPEATWLWLQWATATGTQMMMVADSATRYVPTRTSVASSSFVQEIMATPAYSPAVISQQILASGKIGFVPPFKGSTAGADTIATAVFDAFTGTSTAQEALDSAQAKLVASTYTF